MSVKITLLFLLSLITNVTIAHELRPSIINMTVTDNAIKTTRLMVNLESLIAGIEPEHENTTESENSEQYEQLRTLTPEQLAEAFETFKPSFESLFNLTTLQGESIPVLASIGNIPAVGDTRVARDTELLLALQWPEQALGFKWQWDASLGDVIVRVNSGGNTLDHAELVRQGDQSDAVVIGTVSQASLGEVVIDYLKSGFVHIVPRGLDHILFVIAIFLMSPAWRPLLWQISVFTVAHSITLVLGTIGIINLSGPWVEALIAASIVWLCIENIISNKVQQRRLWVIFVFGLLHGLGFASVLLQVGLTTSHYMAALVAFNVGVEIGQIVVVGLCLLLIASWASSKPWYRTRIVMPGSLAIAAVAGFWVVERLQLV